jgi:DNA-binding transcriptional regulator GbsR (MarR family)
MKPTDSQLGYVELVGRWWEAQGQSRTGGRILGWLMICEPPHQSASDLIENLSISSGSVSMLIRQLELIDLVERVTFPGDRTTYFQIPRYAWSGVMSGEQRRIKEMGELVVAAEPVMPESRQDRIADLGHLVDFFDREWPDLMERFQRQLDKEAP